MAEPKNPKLAVLKGGLNIAKRLLKDDEAEAEAIKAVTAAQRAEAGRKAAELIKSQPSTKASEALGQLMEKGMKRVTTTQADRTRVGGGNIGGAPFSALSEADPNYAGKVWGVMDEGTASRLKNLTTPDTAWTTMLGSANQLKTNPIVFDKLKRQFFDAMKQGKLSPELEAKINHNLALSFGEGAQIRDPSIWKQADTFEKRAALADLMMGQGIPPKKGGVALGGEKSGKGVIFKPTDTLIRETEPTLLHPEHGGDTPTFAAGPRLFRLDPTSEFRPDLHPGFPTMLHGKDLGYNMEPVPTEVFLPTWHKEFKEKKPERFQGPWAQDIIDRRKSKAYKLKGAEGPGYYDLALGLEGEGLPSQALNDEYIRHLLREGFKKGGAVDIKAADARLAKAIENRMAKGGVVDLEAADARLSDAIAKRMGMADGGEVGFKKIQFMADGGSVFKKLTFMAEGGGVPHMAGGGKLKALGKIGKRLLADPDAATPSISGGTRKFGDDAGGLNIMKETGGNWLGGVGSPERALKPLRQRLNAPESLASTSSYDPAENLALLEKTWTPELIEKQSKLFPSIGTAVNEAKARLKPQAALNNWVDSNLTNYVKKQMATPNDPVRKLSEEGITHMPKNEIDFHTQWIPEDLALSRMNAGFPTEGVGKSNTAKGWEAISDSYIYSAPAKDYLKPLTDSEVRRGFKSVVDDNDWLNKVDPEAPVTYLKSPDSLSKDLGFDHIMDVLKMDIAAGRIRPEQLNKVSMEQAVRRTYEYDQEMARKMQETALQQQEGFPLYKEYPEGYRWIELTAPKDNPKRLSEIDTLLNANRQGGEYGVDWLRGANGEKEYFVTKGSGRNTVYMDKFPTEEEAIARGKELSGQQIDVDALRAEREGLTKEVREKKLEDALKYEGNTMGHCVGNYCDDVAEGRTRIYSLRDAKGEPHVTIEVQPDQDILGFKNAKENYPELYAKYSADKNKYSNSWRDFLRKEAPEVLENVPKQIVQIKGKQNAAPNEEYLPFVQDFVKSGEWSDVGDFKNTGLLRADDVRKAGWDMGDIDQKYLTKQEYDDLLLRQLKEKHGGVIHRAEGGGAFKKISFYDKGGITTSGGTFSPEELGVNADELGISDKRLNQIKRNAAGLLGEGKEQLEQEYKQAIGKGGKKDFAIRVGSQFLGGGADLVNLGLEGLDLIQGVIPALSKSESVLDVAGDRVPKFRLASDKPFLGSQQFIDKFKEAKLLGENEFPLSEVIAGFVGPAAAVGALRKGKQAYKGAKALVDTPKKRQGGLTAMAR